MCFIKTPPKYQDETIPRIQKIIIHGRTTLTPGTNLRNANELHQTWGVDDQNYRQIMAQVV